jgi:glycosyltransferase involved in cell wall biosynthesis
MKLGLEPDVQMVGIAATLRSWKGHEFLIDALALLARPGLHLVIIGDGPQWDNLQRKVVEAGLKGLVVFTGHQSNVHEWLRCLDIFCLPSYANEGVPQALIQAMLTALPCVTTAAGAISEIAIHGETALVCPMRDASALATAIGALLSDAQLAEELGLSARELCEAEHSLDTMADKMEQVFQQAIALKHKDMKP